MLGGLRRLGRRKASWMVVAALSGGGWLYELKKLSVAPGEGWGLLPVVVGWRECSAGWAGCDVFEREPSSWKGK